MIFTETRLSGAYVIDLEYINDERGFFARAWCKKEFEKYGLNSNLVQCNLSHNVKRGTLRGMHYQAAPYEEAKLVSCISGAIYDVIVDLREKSPTFKQWQAFELSAQNHRMLYIPEGFAHGFQTLQDNTSVFYQMSDFYHPECARGVRWDDSTINVEWPKIKEMIISSKDKSYANFIA
ncbi:dTDP-4-dehydrorhamnose 3,5-epimerase [Anaerospora sp.]|uniref:dTDP-4-dehydrorhamnose 3,5-epimerase n=1 Tax=Anaerospora sp. TaxID=1960278 RepID=UPI002898644C|nr:dTDP-4-dehydrorhamnose 3,5-epimerase [Anaerospora sp.]